MMQAYKAWLYYADQDWLFAQSGMRDGFYAHVCYLMQQSVEKTMKAYLVYQNVVFPKTHGLLTIYRLMKVDWLDAQLAPLKKLSEFYIPVRYPDAVVGTLPDGLPDKEDAENALKWAGDVVRIVRDHLPG